MDHGSWTPWSSLDDLSTNRLTTKLIWHTSNLSVIGRHVQMKKKLSFINVLRRDIRNQTARSLHFRVYLAYGDGRFCSLLGRV